MKKIKAQIMPVTSLTEADIRLFIDWVWKMRHINLFDPMVLSYPFVSMWRTDNGEEPLMYIPMQAVLMFDAIASKPGITDRESALSLLKIGDELDKAMDATGYRETYFLTSDDRVADYVQRHGDRGFEEIKGVRVLRRKAKPQEKPIPEPITEETHEG